jgi:penicillin-binding protein 2
LRRSDFDPNYIEILNKQLKKTTLLILVIFGVLILRLWFLQIVNGSTYRTKSESNRINLRAIPPFRGIIFDRNGEMLVGNRPSYDLYVIPEEVQDQKRLSGSLKRLIGLEPQMIEQKLDGASRRYPFRPICLKRDISRNELAVIETHRFNLPGIMIKIKPQRHYIQGNLAAHLLGYLGEIDEDQLRSGRYPYSKPGDLIGKTGVELKWQPFLNGMPGGEQVEVDAAGRKIRSISRKPPISGANIYLTIDKDLQALAERCLEDKKGAIVALNPNNGEILAMASSPCFDPNLFIGGIDRTTWEKIVSSESFPLQNRVLSGQYPPGSIFKIVIALAGLEEGIIDPEEELFCNGTYSLGEHTYRCWRKHGHGMVNLRRALVESCDVYFYKMGKRLGVDNIARYARRLGLGKETGFSVGQEKEGLIPTSKWKLKRFGVPWQLGETISMSIGQSFVLVTPIQVASMIAAVFNGGFIFKPQVTKQAGKEGDDKGYNFRPQMVQSAGFKKEHLDFVKSALVGAVNDTRGTGWRAKLKDITVAGKTGTAQVITLEKDKEKDFKADEIPPRLRDHAWFVAVAPAEKPRIALAIIIENGGHGGKVAAPIGKKMIMSYLGKSLQVFACRPQNN